MKIIKKGFMYPNKSVSNYNVYNSKSIWDKVKVNNHYLLQKETIGLHITDGKSLSEASGILGFYNPTDKVILYQQSSEELLSNRKEYELLYKKFRLVIKKFPNFVLGLNDEYLTGLLSAYADRDGLYLKTATDVNDSLSGDYLISELKWFNYNPTELLNRGKKLILVTSYINSDLLTEKLAYIRENVPKDLTDNIIISTNEPIYTKSLIDRR